MNSYSQWTLPGWGSLTFWDPLCQFRSQALSLSYPISFSFISGTLFNIRAGGKNKPKCLSLTFFSLSDLPISSVRSQGKAVLPSLSRCLSSYHSVLKIPLSPLWRWVSPYCLGCLQNGFSALLPAETTGLITFGLVPLYLLVLGAFKDKNISTCNSDSSTGVQAFYLITS